MVQAQPGSSILPNVEIFDAKKPLLGDVCGDLSLSLYAANPVYLDVSHGRSLLLSRSGSPLLLFPLVGLPASIIGFYVLLFKIGFVGGVVNAIVNCFSILVLLGFFVLSIMFIAVAIRSFRVPLDNIVRFDRKRQMVYLMKEKREAMENIHSLKDFFEMASYKKEFLAIPWKNLVPVLHRKFAYGQLYSAMLAEFDPEKTSKNWHKRLRQTNGTPHFVRVGFQDWSGVLGDNASAMRMMLQLEAVRRFMEEGYGTWIKPKRWKRLNRPDWRFFFTFHDQAEQELVDEEEKKTKWKVFDFVVNTLFLPIFILCFGIGWFSMRFASAPKFPEHIEKMHEADLNELGINQYGEPLQEITDKPESASPQKSRLWLFDKVLCLSAFALIFIGMPLCIALSIPEPLPKPQVTVKKYQKQHNTDMKEYFARGNDATIDADYLPFILLALSATAIGIATFTFPLMRKVNPDSSAWIKANPVPESEQDPWLTRMDIAGFSVPVRVHAVMEEGTELT